MRLSEKSPRKYIFIHIFSQTVCEARLMAIDDCRDNPCQNGERIDLENDYRCQCHSGYGGKNCDQNCPVDNPLYRVVDGVCLR